LSYLANTQTNRQTKSGKNITSLAEVKIPNQFLLYRFWNQELLRVQRRYLSCNSTSASLFSLSNWNM